LSSTTPGTARLVLLGPPGAGKGTQAVRLAERLGVPAISTGDIFRANIKGGTELGRTAQEFTSRGELVPDEVTNAMVRDRLAADDTAHGFLLDGYPRNVAQVGELDAILADSGRAIDAAVEITADADVVVERLLKRAEIEGRADDTEPVIRHRLDVYAEQTAPISGVYAGRDLLVQVDGIGEVDEVTERLLAALASHVG
jgi:adenylate kinase